MLIAAFASAFWKDEVGNAAHMDHPQSAIDNIIDGLQMEKNEFRFAFKRKKVYLYQKRVRPVG